LIEVATFALQLLIDSSYFFSTLLRIICCSQVQLHFSSDAREHKLPDVLLLNACPHWRQHL